MTHNTAKICSNRGPNNRKCRVYTPEDREASLISQDHQFPSNRISKESRGVSHERILSKNTKLAKPKVQSKPILASFKLQNSSFPDTFTRTTSQEDNGNDNNSMSDTAISNTDDPKVDLCSELYKVTAQLADMRKGPSIPAEGSYIKIAGEEKNGNELDNYFDFDNPNIQNQDTDLHCETNYLEIEDSQIAKCIYPINDFETHMVRSKSLEGLQSPKHSVPKDMLSEMLYEPVQGIMAEKSNFTTLTAAANIDQNQVRKNVTKYCKKQLDLKMHFMKKTKHSKEKCCPNSKVPNNCNFIFEDFSTDSELAKLGEKIRRQLEKQKK